MFQPRYGAATDVGLLRDHNEDTLLVAPELGLYLVADGMGGHNAGEVASEIAARHIRDAVAGGTALAQAVVSAHEAVQVTAAAGVGQEDMGTTVVALRVEGSRYEVAWVGDSRAYLWDGTRLSQLTRDHSLVQKMLDAGAITQEEALCHPDRNVISQAVGSRDLPSIQVDRVAGNLHRGWRILLCSDGLSGEVGDAEIAEILARKGDEPETVRALIQAALAHGGSDNVTAVLVAAPPEAPAYRSVTATRPIDSAALNRKLRLSRWRVPLISAAPSLVLIVAALAAWQWWQPTPRPARGGGAGQLLRDPVVGVGSPNRHGGAALRRAGGRASSAEGVGNVEVRRPPVAEGQEPPTGTRGPATEVPAENSEVTPTFHAGNKPGQPSLMPKRTAPKRVGARGTAFEPASAASQPPASESANDTRAPSSAVRDDSDKQHRALPKNKSEKPVPESQWRFGGTPGPTIDAARGNAVPAPADQAPFNSNNDVSLPGDAGGVETRGLPQSPEPLAVHRGSSSADGVPHPAADLRMDDGHTEIPLSILLNKATQVQ